MTTKKIIPISQVRSYTPDDIDALHDRLEGDGYMRMMQIGEPRLSELVTKYKGKGYEVEVVPFVDDGDDGERVPTGGGCGPGSCSSGASSNGSAGGCASGGCSSAAGTPVRDARTRTVVPGVSTIYVRMPARPVEARTVP
ncbi:hypothetical protein GPA27_23185 [Aromatoleum toluolicum]|uniref:Uncharacterized protein n=1 Tax=Aromatoleum toluolicum TaxID=90060 RepID=A0ABX1NMG6_9RHOO|nr:hypothetical protein [Aromatoleum toluolicum]NMG00284.1 hypothetical protein [Aromatoleum toluolicum]